MTQSLFFFLCSIVDDQPKKQHACNTCSCC